MDVIVLNGASSSGKSSIAKELQLIMPDNYLHLGIDTFITMMPERSNQLDLADRPTEGFYFQTHHSNGSKSLKVQSGSYGKQVNRAYHSTVKHLADTGIKLIVDEVMDGKSEQEVWQGNLGDTQTIYVAVMCAPYELIAREQLRDDRIDGSAIEQAGRVHKDVVYDLIVDTTTCLPNVCAHEILTYITTYSR